MEIITMLFFIAASVIGVKTIMAIQNAKKEKQRKLDEEVVIHFKPSFSFLAKFGFKPKQVIKHLVLKNCKMADLSPELQAEIKTIYEKGFGFGLEVRDFILNEKKIEDKEVIMMVGTTENNVYCVYHHNFVEN